MLSIIIMQQLEDLTFKGTKTGKTETLYSKRIFVAQRGHEKKKYSKGTMLCEQGKADQQ